LAFQNIFISNDVKITTKNEQLIISKDDDNSIPLEDINCIMIESLHSIISTYTFQKFSQYGIAVYLCDEKHHPNSIVLPFNSHTRHYKMIKYQLELSKPQKKRLWQQIIKMKIHNQALCYEMIGGDSSYLYSLEKKVTSGDTTNVEATAAVYFFKALYGNDFKRYNDNFVNSSLNYGYAIVRGVIARSIVCHGLEPSFGLFHRSELNSFNLADDFIEPLRPFVDYFINLKLLNENVENNENLLPSHKRSIFSMLTYCIKSNNQDHLLSNAIERMIISYLTVLYGVNSELILPELCQLRQYEYK
jgi:CRISPR-associated protein Cas1